MWGPRKRSDRRFTTAPLIVNRFGPLRYTISRPQGMENSETLKTPQLLYIPEVVIHFCSINLIYINWVTTSWTDSYS